MRVLVTGGSGFIGTNLVSSLQTNGHIVQSLDTKPPENVEHQDVYREVDILDAKLLDTILEDFQPSHVVHLAARTALDGKSLSDYSANTVGVKNVINAVAKAASIKQVIFTSTKLVYPNGHNIISDEDFCPTTLYGASKVEGERIIRSSSLLKIPWCIVRPTSIWGPWFGAPYRGLFLAIANGYYFHIGRIDPPRSFGYVGNAVFQIGKIMEAADEDIQGRTFYLTDYEGITTRQWADIISQRLDKRPAPTVPEPMIQCAALVGDILKNLGWKNPPMTSFRLNNMKTDTTGIPIESTMQITGPKLPYTIEQGVNDTLVWMKQMKLIS